jgi:hypothetical protein
LQRALHITVPTTVPQLLSQVILYPLETIQTRLITQKKHQFYEGISDCARMIYREEGILAFWKGYGAQFTESLAVVAFAEVIKPTFCSKHSRSSKEAYQKQHNGEK